MWLGDEEERRRAGAIVLLARGDVRPTLFSTWLLVGAVDAVTHSLAAVTHSLAGISIVNRSVFRMTRLRLLVKCSATGFYTKLPIELLLMLTSVRGVGLVLYSQRALLILRLLYYPALPTIGTSRPYHMQSNVELSPIEC